MFKRYGSTINRVLISADAPDKKHIRLSEMARCVLMVINLRIAFMHYGELPHDHV